MSPGINVRLNRNCAAINTYGSSCSRLRTGWSGTGARGTPFKFAIDDAIPSSQALVALGTALQPAGPLELDFLGWTNCTLFVSPITILSESTNATGNGVHLLSIPNNASLDGARIYAQWLQLDPGEPGFVAVSDMTGLRVGI